MSVTGNSMFASYRSSNVSTQLDNLRSKSQSRISALLSSLAELEKEYQSFIVESKELLEHIWSIKIGFSFLMCFVEHSTKVEYVLRIQQLADELSLELRSLSNQHAESSVTLVQLDGAFSSLREKLITAVINPETGRREVMDSGKKNSEICSEINNFLLRCLGNMTAIKANCIPDLLEEIGNLKQKLTLSQPLFDFLASGRLYPFMDYTLTPSAELLCRTVVILYSCFVEKMDREMLLSVKAQLRDVLHKIDVKKIYFSGLLAYFKKPKAKYECVLLTNVIHFLESNKTLPQNHQCQDLEKVLKSLETGIHTILEETKREDFNSSVKTLIQMAIPILFLCSKDHKLEASYIEEADRALSRVCNMVRDIQDKFLLLKLHKYPKTNPLGFLEFFCSYIKELQESRAQQIEPLKDEIQALYEEFNLLRSCLMQTKEQKELVDLPEKISSLAYDALYVIDFFLVYESSALIKPSVSRIRDLVTSVKMEMEELSTGFKEMITIEGIQITEEAKLMPYEKDLGKITTSSIPAEVSTISEIGFVGFEDEVKKAVESLAENPYENHVISIVGIPGIGKTTLANKLYKDPIMRGHFDVRAWCTVSQTYRKTELWHSILLQVSGIDAAEYDDERIAEKIAQSLKRRRYLIVIDDIWDILAWKDLRRYLPNDSNGSRVIITTRHHMVAEQTASISSNIYNLRLFNPEESLELFDRKLGLKDNYREDLLQVGHEIALRCKGLPLAISVIAGLVSKVDRTVERWKEIAESLSSYILRDPERPYRAMLEWSYNYLPNHLKPCFLYAGALGACQYIPVWKLKLLWIAEGLIDSNNCGNLETRAEEYLMDLISRSLITPTHTKSIGGVKACVMHDLLHIDYFARFQVKNSEVETSPFPENIETLSRPCFSSTEDAKKLLGRLHKLVKLSCTFLNCWDDSTNCYQFPILDFLTQLVSLKVLFMDSKKHRGANHEFSFPSNLRKLTLTAFAMMSWDEMSNISKKLPNLEVLKIQFSGCDGTWEVDEEDFPNLKYLKLSHRYISEWFASEDSFPKLEQLHLKSCDKLEEIPPWFEEAPCLQIITVESCNNLLCDSALRIEKIQKEEAQNSDFRVDIRK